MARDWAEQERQFIAELREDTGRDLAEWMAMISAAELTEKNAIIDWLRLQGVHFNPAAKLERLYANGGRPLYGDAAAPTSCERVKAGTPPMPAPSSGPGARPASTHPSTRAPRPDPTADPAIANQLALAKGYRPLAMHLLREIWRLAPDLEARPAGAHILLVRATHFALIEPRAKDVRLALALGDHPHEGRLTRAHVKDAPASLTHMIVLADARQVNAELMDLVATAADGAL